MKITHTTLEMIIEHGPDSEVRHMAAELLELRRLQDKGKIPTFAYTAEEVKAAQPVGRPHPMHARLKAERDHALGERDATAATLGDLQAKFDNLVRKYDEVKERLAKSEEQVTLLKGYQDQSALVSELRAKVKELQSEREPGDLGYRVRTILGVPYTWGDRAVLLHLRKLAARTGEKALEAKVTKMTEDLLTRAESDMLSTAVMRVWEGGDAAALIHAIYRLRAPKTNTGTVTCTLVQSGE